MRRGNGAPFPVPALSDAAAIRLARRWMRFSMLAFGLALLGVVLGIVALVGCSPVEHLRCPHAPSSCHPFAVSAP